MDLRRHLSRRNAAQRPRLIHALRTGRFPFGIAGVAWAQRLYKGLINATTSWLYGCSAINGTLLGFGERTGNTPIEVVIEYIETTGDTTSIPRS